MTSLLSSHLQQISLCATSIAGLPFPPPGPFTNALLSDKHDITALIRDTEPHERALFHLAPPTLQSNVPDFASSVTAPNRRATAAARQPKSRAVAAVLGGDLYHQTRKGEANKGQKGDIDVEVLLEGAEKLAAVYPMPGITDKISTLRRHHEDLAANIAHYEDRVARNTRELQLNSKSKQTGYGNKDVDKAEGVEDEATMPMTKEDLAREEEEVRELERKKRALEERVEGMERDLGGLMR